MGQQHLLGPSGRPFRNPNNDLRLLWQAVRQIEANQQQMTDHINNWVAKIQGIDSVAFAALALHDGKKFELSKERVQEIRAEINAVLAEMERYRAERQKEAQEQAATVPAETPAEQPEPEKKDDRGTDTTEG